MKYFADSTCISIEIWNMNFANKFKRLTIKKKEKQSMVELCKFQKEKLVKLKMAMRNYKKADK